MATDCSCCVPRAACGLLSYLSRPVDLLNARVQLAGFLRVGVRLLFAPAVRQNCRKLIAAHPTRGIDVGAQAEIWEDLRQARAAGLAVLLVSADLEELIGLSDTLVVLLRGRLVATLDPATVTPADLGSYMTGAREEQGAA